MCKLPHCGHVFCWECVKDHFKEKLQSVDPNGLGYPCLEGDCSTQLSLVDLLNLNYVTKAQYTTVLKFVSNNIIDTDNHVVQCPNNKCLYRYYETKTGCQPTKCPKCNKEFCIECKQNWHPNLTCKEAEAKRKNDNESEKFIYQTTRPCPYCGVPIFKDEGCRYMKCSKCSGFFCWICMEKTGNHVHKNGVRWGDCKEWKLGTPYPQ
ncbi:RBR-type E3 ubiquitin transferase [Entamoeba marina]